MSRSLLDVLRTVTLDPGEQAAFMADRAGYLAQYGYEDVPDDALTEAFSLVADTLPADVAQTVAPAGGEGFGSFGSAESDIVDDDGTAAVQDGLVAEPTVDPDADQTSFGEVNNDFDDEPGAELGQGDDADDLDDVDDTAPDDGGNGGNGDAFGFGEGSEADGLDDTDFGDLADGSAPIDDAVDAADQAAADAADDGLDVDDGLTDGVDDALALDDAGLDDLDLDHDGDFGTGDADDGDLDLDDALDDGLDLGDPGDIDDIGAF